MEQSLVATQIVTAIVTAGIQVITLVVVIIYTRYTAKMTSAAKASAEAANRTIDEMKEAREQENAPYVVVYFDVPPNEFVIHLVIKNVGKSIATDVKMKFTPPLSSVVFSGINDVPLIKDGISSLPPQYEIRTFFDGIIQHFGNPNLPLSSTVEVSFSGGLGNKRRTSEQILDLSMFYGLLSSRKKGMDDLVKAVEEIDKNLDKISDHLKEVSESLTSGISIKNPILTTSELNLHPDSWQNSIRAKLNEFRFLWSSVYGGETEKLQNPFLSDLQNKLLLICEQIIVILSGSPILTSKELLEDLSKIAAGLSALGRKRFYIDGGRSDSEFNDLGENIVKMTENILVQFSSYSESQPIDNDEEEPEYYGLAT